MKRSAECSCGQLAAQCDGEPASVSLCHCRACQKRTGSAFGVAAFFEREKVAVSGQSSRFDRMSEHGHAIAFHFCPQCGSTVYWEPSRKADMIAVALGAFADPDFPPPSKEVFVESAQEWARLTR